MRDNPDTKQHVNRGDGRPADGAGGVHDLPPREKMIPAARKLRDAYACKPGAPLFQREFGFYCLDRWKEQGMPQDVPLETLFGYDPPAKVALHEAGWCEPEFHPWFENRVIEDRGDCELAQDHADRHVLYFKGRRSGFMPEYVDHPVNSPSIAIVPAIVQP